MCSWADINCQRVSLSPSLAHCAGHTTEEHGLGRDANGNDTKTTTVGERERERERWCVVLSILPGNDLCWVHWPPARIWRGF